MITSVDSANRFVCPYCRGALHDESALWTCGTCGKVYPLVCGVPVLHTNPIGLISRWWQWSLMATSGGTPVVDDLREMPTESLRKFVSAASRRIGPLVEILGENLSNRLAPGNWLGDPLLSLADELCTINFGWDIDQLRGYFLRDWCSVGAPRLALKEKLFPGKRDRCAVLGIGGGGAVRELSEHFENVDGIDLSIPAVMAVQRYIDRTTIDTSYFPAGVHADNRSRGLLVADALRTPFPSKSLDLVVTEFLVDVVANLGALISEVSRILDPNGVWLMVGPLPPIPLISRNVLRFDLPTFCEYLEEQGFRCVSAEECEVVVPQVWHPIESRMQITQPIAICAFRQATLRRRPPQPSWRASDVRFSVQSAAGAKPDSSRHFLEIGDRRYPISARLHMALAEVCLLAEQRLPQQALVHAVSEKLAISIDDAAGMLDYMNLDLNILLTRGV